jgi:tricorn protease
VNENSASDGDIFPHRFRQAGLGPLIGRRTWGGVVGISSLGTLIDGGAVMVPLQATNSPEGDYIIEGEGVVPDIDVVNEPKDVQAGKDAQLERGIEEVLSRMKAEPKALPKRPADPVKTK